MERDEIKVTKKKYVPTSDFYSQVIDSLQDYAVITTDHDLIINSWSSGASKILGYEADEIIGNHIDIVFTIEDIKKGIPKAELETALQKGRAIDNRWHVRKDESKFFAFGLAFPLIDNEGELLGLVKIMRDLTVEKKSEEAIKKYVKELEELNSHKNNILAILSHDLRSPLAVINSAAQLLKLKYDEMPKNEVFKILDIIHRASTNELQMFDYLLEWARIKYASETYDPQKIDINSVIENVFEKLREVADVSAVKLNNEIPDNTIVYADEKMIHSVFRNLLSNAIKFSHDGGVVTLSADLQEDKVIIRVSDTGIGISEEAQQQLFTPQMNVLSNSIKDNKGAGIGLLLVKDFVEKNGGKIWVESIEGEGSSFYFTLPVNYPNNKESSHEEMQ